MKNHLKKIILFLLVLSLFACLAACNSAGKSDENASMPSSGEHYNTGIDADGGVGSAEIPDKKIIRRAEVSAETKDYEGAKSTITTLVTTLGGYTESSRESTPGNGRARTLYLTLRIPAEQLDAFLSKTGDAIRVTNSNITSDDITAKYYDAEARLTTLKAEKAALDAMLEKATSTAEILQIHERLYDVMEEIDSLTAKLNVYKSEVAMSTVTLNLYEVVEYSPDAKKDSFGTRIGNAFFAGWKGFAAFCQGFLIVVVRIMPVLVIGAAVAAVVILIVKLRQKRGKKTPPTDPPQQKS